MPLDGRQNEFWEAATVNGSVLLLSVDGGVDVDKASSGPHGVEAGAHLAPDAAA